MVALCVVVTSGQVLKKILLKYVSAVFSQKYKAICLRANPHQITLSEMSLQELKYILKSYYHNLVLERLGKEETPKRHRKGAFVQRAILRRGHFGTSSTPHRVQAKKERNECRTTLSSHLTNVGDNGHRPPVLTHSL